MRAITLSPFCWTGTLDTLTRLASVPSGLDGISLRLTRTSCTHHTHPAVPSLAEESTRVS